MTARKPKGHDTHCRLALLNVLYLLGTTSLWAPTKPCAVNAFADCVHPSLHLLTSVLQCAIPCSEDVPWACHSLHSLLYLLVSSNKGKPVMVQYKLLSLLRLRFFKVISLGLQLANELTQRSPVPNIRPRWPPKPLKWQCAVQVLPTPTWAQSWRKRCSWRRPCLRKKQTCSCAGHIPRQICYQASVQRPYTYSATMVTVSFRKLPRFLRVCISFHALLPPPFNF